MMSSEEDVTVDSFGLLQKSKRSRRVDAGEPRNSYSSIPNFSSRPNLLNYGAFFAAQNHQHFASSGAYFNQGFGPSKMLNELLSRRVKTITDSSDGMMTIDVAGNDVSSISSSAYDCLNSQSPVSRVTNTLNGGGGSPPVGEMAQHMLRNILQGVGRKKELFALEQELKATGNNINELNADCNADSGVLNNNNNNNHNHNNNNINNNNSNNNNNDLKVINLSNEESGCGDENNDVVLRNSVENVKENLTNGDVEDMDIGETDEPKDRMDESINEVSPLNHHDNNLIKSSRDNESSTSERSILSPESVSNKDDAEDSNKDGGLSFPKVEQVELKRARVENIVSSMRSSPLPVPVNGCKKRKLYHPQQHDTERYANLNDTTDVLSDEDDGNLSPTGIREKAVKKKNALENKLRIMQKELAAMQQYVQLCSRRGSDSDDTPKEEDVSDVDQEDESSIPSPGKNNSLSPTPTPTPTQTPTPVTKEPVLSFPANSTAPTQPSISPAISKILSSKYLPQNTNGPPLNPHSFPLHPNFNGALSFLQHQMFQEQQHVQNHLQPHHHGHHHHPVHPHPALSNAAAMYLGVSQKLFMEQEARMAKESALAAEHQQQLANQNSNSHSQPSSQPPNHSSQSHASNLTKAEPSSPSRQTEQSSKREGGNQSSHPQQTLKSEFSERLQTLNLNANSPSDSFDYEGLATALKSEIRSSMTNLFNLIDRYIQTKRHSGRSTDTLAAEQLNKDLLLASQLLDRKSPRTKVIDRGNCGSTEKGVGGYSSNNNHTTPTKGGLSHPNSSNSSQSQNYASSNPENNINAINLPSGRGSALNTNLFPPNKLNSNSINAAAALYSMNSLNSSHLNPFCLPDIRGDGNVPEQNEALSLVVAPKKKRHKVTDTRITPRTVSRILAQDGVGCPPSNVLDSPNKFASMLPTTNGSPESPPPRPFHVPPSAPMLPVSLPTSVAIPNPSLHESQVFSPYSPFYPGQHQTPHHLQSSSPPGNMVDHLRDSPPLPHHSSLFHPALLAAAQQQQQQQQQHHHQRVSSPPDYMRSGSVLGAGDDRGSECTSMEYDGMPPTSSTLSPMHLRKAKLMFFWVRYPSSAVLKMYFPDIKFNKNNTAQLVKWFSNFREFYYIQMEKYARAAMADGIKNPDDLRVTVDCDIYRVLNLHYNRNNHIEVPPNFRYVVEQTLKEFFKAIQTGKDSEQSWKKSIYKVISRLDDPVPEYFKTPNFLEQLE